MKYYILILMMLGAFSAFSQHCTKSKWDDHSQKQIMAHLDGELDENTVAVRVKGLVCESCGIGIRKKIPKVEGVDKKRFNKGVKMDPYRMLAYISVKPSQSLSLESVQKALDAAGYEGVYYYEKKSGKVTTENL